MTQMTSEAKQDRTGDVDVSVLIPVLNEEQHLEDVCAAMLEQQFDGQIEFIFIDGASEDRSREILVELAAKDRRIVVLDNPKRRTPFALNIGLRSARGTYIARMDAHTEYPKNYLASGVERLLQGDIINVGGPQIATGHDVWSSRVARVLSTRLGVGGSQFRKPLTDEVEVDTVFAGMWRRDTLAAVSGWNEEWVIDQDFELATRLRKQNGRIVCIPAMAAKYFPRNSLRTLARQYWRYGYYRVKTSRSHPESMRRSHLLPPGLAVAAVASVAAPQGVKTLARKGMVAWLGAIALTTLRLLFRKRGRAAGDSAVKESVAIPAIFGTLHLSYGAGFIAACLREGLPIAAIIQLVPGVRKRPNISE